MNIAIDLDGTLAHYTGYQGPMHIGDPYPGAVEWLKALSEAGHRLWLYTARATDPDQTRPLLAWLGQHNLAQYFEGITCKKEYFFDVFVDDRAVRFEGTYPSIDELLSTRPWWKALNKLA